MSKSASRARQVNNGVVYTFAAATVAAVITFAALSWLLENLLGLGFAITLLPCLIPAIAVALFVRGRLGGKWMLSAFRQNELSEHRHLMMDAQANHLIDLPGDSLYTYWGPSRLTKLELERYYQQIHADRNLRFRFQQDASTTPKSYGDATSYTEEMPRSESGLQKPKSSGSYMISGRTLLKSMIGSIWQIMLVVFMLRFISISWIGIVIFAAACYYLFEKHWKTIRQYQNKTKILFFDQEGVRINFPDGLLQLPWRDINDVVFRNVLVEDSADDEWLQLSTNTRGQISLRLNMLDVKHPGEIEETFTHWRNWAHQERMRIAMGEKPSRR